MKIPNRGRGRSKRERERERKRERESIVMRELVKEREEDRERMCVNLCRRIEHACVYWRCEH